MRKGRHNNAMKSRKDINYSLNFKTFLCDVMKMFQTGDDFYAAMGLLRVPNSFWELSMLEKPQDGRQVICHATAWDFYDGKVIMIRQYWNIFNFSFIFSCQDFGMNDEFWRLKMDLAGVKTPVDRTNADLDPPTLFHICQDYDMIRYFVRTILQFQFAEALCQISGHQGPLHRCDFSGSKEALALKLGQESILARCTGSF